MKGHVYAGLDRQLPHVAKSDFLSTYTYSADGRLATRTWARGITTAYSYTNTGEMVGIDYSNAAPNVSFTFNRLGQQVTVTDGQGTREFTYNDYLQLAVETNASSLLTRTYDSLGRSSGFTLGSDYAVGYEYSADNRFFAVTSSVAGVSQRFEYQYLANSDMISGVSNGVLQVARSYEPNRNLLTSMVNTAGANPISRFDYTSDQVGRRTQRIDSLAVTNVFGYNMRSELTAATMGANNYGYQYDPIGNRLTATNNAEALSYAANALNQYTNIADGVVLTPTYDLDGNMVTYGDWTFAWDGENRLIGASNGTTVVAFAYDYMGRRYQKVVGSVTNTFLYDGWAMIREQSATATSSYVYGLDLSGSMQGAGTIGGILWENLNGAIAFPAFDGNGNLTDLTDASGTSVGHYEYDPYGNAIVKTGALADANPFRFSTKYYDSETGLVYYGLRFYSANLARWISRDPIVEKGGLGVYLFVQNAAIGSVDAYGLVPGFAVPMTPGGPWFPPATSVPVDDKCGPEVNEKLQAALNDIETTFVNHWTRTERCIACLNLVVPSAKALDAWDIEPLARLGYSGIYAHTWAEMGIGGTQGTGTLDKTVALNGKCYTASGVNYAMWGKVNQLCHIYYGKDIWSETAARAYVTTYKTLIWWGAGLDEALAFTGYGYTGADPSAQAKASAEVDPANTATRTFDWRWSNSPLSKWATDLLSKLL